MPVSREVLVSAVNAELENYTRKGSAEATADGTLKSFLVAPHGYFIVDDADFAVYVDGVEESGYTMDFDSGVCTLESTPNDGSSVSFVYNYLYWPSSLVLNAINAGIGVLFPDMYVEDTTTITSDGESYEYEAPENTVFIRHVFYKSETAESWSLLRKGVRWTWYQAGANKYIRFFSPPASGSLRVHTISRPYQFSSQQYTTLTITAITSNGEITTYQSHGLSDGDYVTISGTSTTPSINDTIQVTVVDSDTFSIGKSLSVSSSTGAAVFSETLGSTCKLPDTAKDPIISYACYYLLTQKVAPRVRNDIAVVTQGRGVLSPRQMNDSAQAFAFRYQLQLAKAKMQPWGAL